jgi:hypothetical protein
MSRCPDASRRVQPIRRLSVQSGGSLTPDDWTDAGRQRTSVPRATCCEVAT